MRILVAVVHYWDPDGGGRHQSLMPDPTPRVEALQELILSLLRISANQAALDISAKAVVPCNTLLKHDIEISIITDGVHHVLDHLDNEFHGTYRFVHCSPISPRHLGFEAQRYLASRLKDDYDYYCYLEDDLVLHDALFFSKLKLFTHSFGTNNLLLPHRFEAPCTPSRINKFYIDGALDLTEIQKIIPSPQPQLSISSFGDDMCFESPANPHSGCYFLSKDQLDFWFNHHTWDSFDDSWISPLESAATLGISKVFNLYKPSFDYCSWLEIQHWGTSFHVKIHEDDS